MEAGPSTWEMAEKLVKASWFERIAAPPDKFVVLVDTNGGTPDEVLRPFREQLPGRIPAKIGGAMTICVCQWHRRLYFADNQGLRGYAIAKGVLTPLRFRKRLRGGSIPRPSTSEVRASTDSSKPLETVSLLRRLRRGERESASSDRRSSCVLRRTSRL